MVSFALTNWFKELSKESVPIAGGKGASLGEMLNSKIPVPDGFVILSNSFEKFLEETDLNVELDSILHKVNHEEMQSIENASEEIKALIMNAKMPKDIEKEIKEKFKVLNSKFVAVRSSATSEDSSSAAWAGQLDSFLNTTEKDLFENVKRCWASLFTPRAIFYRFEKGLHTTKISVAVVVQRMVNSEISGIAFSVHPVTQDRNQLIIEAGFGLGEAIVSGQITPDSYVVEKNPRRIIDKNISKQERGLFRISSGGNEWKSTLANGAQQKLSEKQIHELTEIILRIEKHYQFPCDIEWAFESNKFFIVQSRPITTLTDKADDKEMPSALESFNADSTKIVADKKIISNKEIVSNNSDEIIKNICAMHWEKWLERPFQAFTLSLFEDSCTQKSFEEIGFKGISSRPQLFQNGSWFYNKSEMESMDAELEKYLEKHSMKDITDSLAKLKKTSEKKIKALIKSSKFISPEKKFEQVYGLLKNACSFAWLAHGIDSFYTRKLNQEVPKYVKGDINKFIGDASFPKKKNSNAMLVDLMRTKISDEEIAKKAGWVKVRDGFSEPFTAKEIKEMRKELPKVEKVKKVIIPKQLKKLFAEVQELVFFRTERTDVLYQIYFQARPILKELAGKYNIPFNEMRYYRAKSFIFGKPERYNALVTFAFDKKNIIFQNEPIISVDENEKNNFSTISGVIAFAGKVTGIVKVVKNITELNKVNQGDILVTQMTVPSFIPAMNRAIAFVTDEGGITCHAAIVAREMKKPCIIGTKNATKILKDGDLIEVDANKGTVKVLSSTTSKKNSFELNTFQEVESYLKSNEIDVQNANATPLIVSFVFEAYVNSDSLNGVNFSPNFSFSKGLNFTQLTSKRCMNDLGLAIFKRSIENKNYVKNLIKQHLEIQKKTDLLWGEFQKTNLEEDSFEVLAKKIKSIFEIGKKWWGFAVICEDKGEAVGKLITSELSKIRNISESEAKELLSVLSHPKETAFFTKERICFLNVCKLVLKKKLSYKTALLDKDFLNAYKNYFSKYFYFKTNFREREIITKEVFAKDVFEAIKGKSIKEILLEEKKILSGTKKISILRAQKEKSISLSVEEKNLVSLMEQIIIWLDYRKEGMMKQIYYLSCLLHAISENKKVSYTTLEQLSIGEFNSFLENKFTIDDKLVEKRKEQGFMVFQKNQPTSFFYGADAKKLLELCLLSQNSKDVVGQVASKGSKNLYRGIARIISDPKNQSFSKGEILVTSMTRIEFVPLMNKALAIITDEGGVACHAAIVSRELGIPCIIGTKNATKILKDGDLIEVDTNTGTVKIIESKNILAKTSALLSNDKNSLKIVEMSITRDLPLANSYVWHNAYSKGMLDFIGWCYSETLFHHHGGHVDIIRSADEQNISFRDYVLDRISNSRKWFFKISKEYVKILNEFDSFFKKNISLKNKSNNEIAKVFEEYCSFFGKIMGPFVIMYWLPNWFKDGNKENIELEKEIKVALKLRTQFQNSVPNGDELVREILKKVQKQLGLKNDLQNFITHEELLNYLKKGIKPSVNELEKRTGGLIYSSAGVTLVSELNLDSAFEKLGYCYKRIENIKENEISGQSAYLGKVEGVVKILLNKKEIPKFPKGSVLVTGMTTPEFIPAMKKAIAIITEEGGITCHAAIIAREMKKPCIIGTKNATKILKDGDLIEVDANNGTVKIIKSKT
jgi:phosphoenolpyruvate synthase/pyruvate phosphate dikinase